MKNILLILLLLSKLAVFSQKVTQAEYYWDTEPGEGNGTPLLALDGNFDGAIEELFKSGVPISGLSTGAHHFSVRVKGQDGSWSDSFTQVIYIDGSLSTITRDVKVTQAEYYWDADPGEGNGTTILALDGNFDEAFEELFASEISTSLLTGGAHHFSVRIKGQDGSWSAPFTQVIYVDGGITTSVNDEIENELMIYPNPTIDYLNIQGHSFDDHIELYDARGVLIGELDAGLSQWNISEYPVGSYFLRVVAKQKSKRLTFIKQ